MVQASKRFIQRLTLALKHVTKPMSDAVPIIQTITKKADISQPNTANIEWPS